MDWFMGKGRRNKEKEATTPTHQQVQGQGEVRPYLDDDYVQERFLDVDLNLLVNIPHGIDLTEWLATHTKSFFEHVNLMYGCLAEYCLPVSCPSMSGPSQVQYHWLDEKGKKMKCTAPQYIEYVMTFCQKCICDESIFPTKYGNVFPSTFEYTVKKMCRLIFHVISHIYHSHSSDAALLKFHGHLNTIFYHFYLFCRHFSLVEDRELEVLEDLYVKLHHYATRKVQFDDLSSPTSASAEPVVTPGDNSVIGGASEGLKNGSAPSRLLNETSEGYGGVALVT